MKEIYDWVPWFNKLAQKIDEGGEAYLAERAKRVKWNRGNPALLVFGDENIDPFSFFYFLAQCNGLTGREEVYKSIDDVFEIGRQNSLSDLNMNDGFIIPTPTPITPVLFHDKGKGRPNFLWKLFRHAINNPGNINSADFRNVLAIKNVGVAKLTQCLFLINPNYFMPIDKGILEFHKELDLPSFREVRRKIEGRSGWEEYQIILKKFEFIFPGCPIYEINTVLYMSTRDDSKIYKTLARNQKYKKWFKLIRRVIPQTLEYPLNQIFYGPPGTGKTYRTVNAALKIADPDSYEEHNGDRESLLEKFNQLKKEGKIAFVTFHQSFGYEEFVEGIRPILENEEDQDVSFKISDGIFKQICKMAASVHLKAEGSSRYLEETGTVWKISLGAGGSIKEECISESTIRIGWPLTGDLRNLNEEGQEYLNNNSGAKSITEQFMEMSQGDLVAVLYDQKHIDAVGIITGEYEYTASQNEIYPHSRKVKWIYSNDEPLNITKLNGGNTLAMRTCYKLHRINVKDLLELVKYEDYQQESKPHVLIIDEINRGNISRIFGELITLIEESKRQGNEEALTVTLPYSRENFGVPNNLYIIGTMNTADRSIALLDTALRRRFRFQEMMPDSGKLEGIEVEGIKISSLLDAMNRRIEALYDRDHQIGHSYFFPLERNNSLETLKDIFRHEVLPLLQEYFYEDWEKINLVLNDNGFLKTKNFPAMPNGDFVDENKKLWSINEDALNTPSRYQKIYTDGTDDNPS